MSIYSQALEQGREDGLKLGRAEGRELGLICGKQEDILELLLDYGSVEEELQKKITAETDMEILKNWLKLANRVNSVEEFKAQLNN